ncbi:MAG: group intron reverse transcriptase/maturase [Burkholderiales bacterium]|jgi:rhodanese-related sulfurtransferase|nr:group intron reverse transcriptase/maturase [Burkholderiales bacterium]
MQKLTLPQVDIGFIVKHGLEFIYWKNLDLVCIGCNQNFVILIDLKIPDDGISHTQTKKQAEALLVELKQRFNECKLEIHPDKTKIVYCKDGNRTEAYQGGKSLYSWAINSGHGRQRIRIPKGIY